MKQVLIKKGKVEFEEVPAPSIMPGHILVQTYYSVVSTGTELAVVGSSGMSIISRAKIQPQNVKKVLKIAKERGVWKTYKFIKGILDFGTPTGYSLCGKVIAVGDDIKEFSVGDLVACAGAGKANHAEFVLIPKNLAVKIPAGVDLKEAASTTIGAIAMQGVRQADLRVGEAAAVIGLGLLGQLTFQILKSSGIKVIGVDLDNKRIETALALGIDYGVMPQGAQKLVSELTAGYGVDATIITAATASSEPLNLAMEITRKKGKVVVVGAVGLNLNRSPWYEKEIDLKISTSYGPGRYDNKYEEEGIDYPYAYVRWTEKRNMESYLDLLKSKKVKFSPLINKVFDIDKAPDAYNYLLSEEKPLVAILDYGAKDIDKNNLETIIRFQPAKLKTDKINIGIIGAGSFASFVHLPNLQKLKNYFEIKAIITKDGVRAKQLAKQYDAEYCGTDYKQIVKDDSLDAVLISTRHNLHGQMVLDALMAGKNVFVEKPLTIYKEELDKIKEFYKSNQSKKPYLMVGFNRRFSPYLERIKELTAKKTTPFIINYRVNAGYLPPNHWTQGAEGGGRVLGEACHFFDVFQYLINSAVVKIDAVGISPKRSDLTYSDNFSAILKYEDGSIAELTYLSIGPKDLDKEYCEVFCDGRVYIINDYKKLDIFDGGGGFRGFAQDKGHLKELELFGKFLKGEIDKPPIELNDILKVTEISFQVNDLLRK